MARTLRGATLSQLDYADPAGQARLRSAIAAHVSSVRGTACTADQVVVVAGAQRGLELTATALLDPGDRAAIEDPGYPGARSALVNAGATIHPVAVDEDGIDVAALPVGDAAPRLVYTTPSHQFPLGVPMTMARRRTLVSWARRHGAWIVEDDYDSEFRYGTSPVPSLHGFDPDGRIIYVGSFSKTLFPALRLGFLIVPSALQALLVRIRRAADLHPPIIDQLVVARLIEDGHFDRHVRRMRTIYHERLEALNHAVGRHAPGLLALRPVLTGLHAVADLSDGIDARQVADAAARAGVEVMPVSAYAIGRHIRADGLVLGFGSVSADLIVRGIKTLAGAIESTGLVTPRAPREAPRRRRESTDRW